MNRRTTHTYPRPAVWIATRLVCLALGWGSMPGWPAQAALSSPRIVRGPYLQLGTQTNIVVRWRTDVPTTAYVAYGTNPVVLLDAVAGPGPATNHAVVLPDLRPDTKYYYAVGTQDGLQIWGPEYRFVTAPSSPKPVRVWAIGDSGTASAGYFGSYQVRDAYQVFAATRPTDVWLMLGDNAYNFGTDAEFQVGVFETYPTLLRNTVLWSTIGNHETYSTLPDGRFAYLDVFTFPQQGEAGGIASGTPYYYSFDYANIHFVCLDSEVSSSSRGEAMLNWLESDLAANTREWLIAFWHSPPYSKGSHDSDNPFDSAGHLFQMRTNVVPVLEAHGVDLVLCGHSHNYERSYFMHGHYGTSSTLQPSMLLDTGSGRDDETGPYRKGASGPGANPGTVYVVAGSSGFATFTTGRHPVMFTQLLRMGSMVLDIDGNRLDAKFLRETGAIDDYFTILKGGGPEPFRLVGFKLSDGQSVVSWKSQSGKLYQVEQTEHLTPPRWIAVSGALLATGTTTSWTNPVPSQITSSYFRVREVDD